jgi:hypothetical protein
MNIVVLLLYGSVVEADLSVLEIGTGVVWV